MNRGSAFVCEKRLRTKCVCFFSGKKTNCRAGAQNDGMPRKVSKRRSLTGSIQFVQQRVVVSRSSYSYVSMYCLITSYSPLGYSIKLLNPCRLIDLSSDSSGIFGRPIINIAVDFSETI